MSAKPKYPPREGDEEIVIEILRDWLEAREPWVGFGRIESAARSQTRDIRGDSLSGRRLVTVLQRLKRAGKVRNRMSDDPWTAGTSEWRLRG